MIPIIVTLIICITLYILITKIQNIAEMANYSSFKFSDVTEEFELFCMNIITKKFFDKVIKSQVDANGNIIAFREFNDISSEFFQGIVIYVRAIIGPELLRRFKLFHNSNNSDEFIINKIVELMESYNIILVERSSMYDLETITENRKRVDRGDNSYDNNKIKQIVYDKLILSMSIDMMKFISINPSKE